ncbi:MAG: ion transporter [Bacteroidales bacterium]|nr:ion transporter [Bacteroidales bacterium]
MKIAYIDVNEDGKIKIYDKNGKMKALLDSPSDGVLKGFGSEFFVMETPESYLSIGVDGKIKGHYFKELGSLAKINDDSVVFFENGNVAYYDSSLQKTSSVKLSEDLSAKETLKDKLIKHADNFITVLIVLNAIAAGAMTYLDDSSPLEHYLNVFCDVSILIFIVEILIRLFCRKKVSTFFTDEDRGWNIFDLIVTVISSLSFFSGLESFVGARAIRILRELRLLRVVSGVDNMKRLFHALMNAMPQISWTALFFVLLCYIYGIIGVEMFGDISEKFTNLHVTFLTLVQIMTLDDWSAMTQEIMTVHPYAWTYFVSFVLLAAYILVNLVVGVVVDSLNEVRAQEDLEKSDELPREITKLEKQFDLVKKLLKENQEQNQNQPV